MATLTFLGATDGVTGSCYLLQTERATILLECGMFQGGREADEANQEPFDFSIDTLDAVVLSHAHLDHSGRLPKLVSEGFQKAVYMTIPTRDLLEIMLKDSASLQERDAEWENKRRKRAGKRTIEPLYTMKDAETSLTLCEGVAYGYRLTVAEGVAVCFRDAGHILGSSIVELFITEDGVEKKLVFSGDLGNSDTALLRDPEIVEEADVLLLESTYGNREHLSMQETLEEFQSILTSAAETGGNILIPSFAVGRTQEIIFHLGELYQKGKLKKQLVFLDSPMAIAATEVYHRYQNIFNTEDKIALKHADSGSLHSFLPSLHYSQSTEESMRLNQIEKGAIIIAGSGMCNGGRIRHHLKHNLWRKDAHVVIVGYQAVGTPGRKLVDGDKKYRIGGDTIVVNATIHTLGGFSAHASQSQLLSWVRNFKKPNPKIYLIHGETEAKEILAEQLINDEWPVSIPAHGETVSF
jgi:metallo-beta-lactamase family protein